MAASPPSAAATAPTPPASPSVQPRESRPDDAAADRQDLKSDQAHMSRDCANMKADKKELRSDLQGRETGYDVTKDRKALHDARVACGAERNDITKDSKDLKQDDADRPAPPPR
jgi:hypothetical protein